MYEVVPQVAGHGGSDSSSSSSFISVESHPVVPVLAVIPAHIPNPGEIIPAPVPPEIVHIPVEPLAPVHAPFVPAPAVSEEVDRPLRPEQLAAYAPTQ